MCSLRRRGWRRGGGRGPSITFDVYGSGVRSLSTVETSRSHLESVDLRIVLGRSLRPLIGPNLGPRTRLTSRSTMNRVRSMRGLSRPLKDWCPEDSVLDREVCRGLSGGPGD